MCRGDAGSSEVVLECVEFRLDFGFRVTVFCCIFEPFVVGFRLLSILRGEVVNCVATGEVFDLDESGGEPAEVVTGFQGVILPVCRLPDMAVIVETEKRRRDASRWDVDAVAYFRWFVTEGWVAVEQFDDLGLVRPWGYVNAVVRVVGAEVNWHRVSSFVVICSRLQCKTVWAIARIRRSQVGESLVFS